MLYYGSFFLIIHTWGFESCDLKNSALEGLLFVYAMCIMFKYVYTCIYIIYMYTHNIYVYIIYMYT